MANTAYTVALSGNYPKVTARKDYLEALNLLFWARFDNASTTKNMRFAKPGEEVGAVSNSPVVFHNELMDGQSDYLDVPLSRQLKGMPKTTGEQMQGHEEKFAINYGSVAVAEFKHAIKVRETNIGGKISSYHRPLKMNHVNLRDHYARSTNHLQLNYAMYYGMSENIFRAATYSQNPYKTATKVSHPHIYVAGSGKVGYSGGYPGSSGYEDAIGTAIDGVTSSDLFDYDFVVFLSKEKQIKRIKPIVIDGEPLKLMLVHSWGMLKLQSETRFREAHIHANHKKKDHPILQGCKYIIEGFAIFEQDFSCWPVNNNASDQPVWGPFTSHFTNDRPDDLDAFDDYEEYAAANTVFTGQILGDNALAKASMMRYQYRNETWDYQTVAGVAYMEISGASRLDYWNRDDGALGQHLVNDGSALFAYYAAKPTY
jgi:hypothetical protein